MRIERLCLKDFRGIHNMELDFQGRSAVLFGINGVGKRISGVLGYKLNGGIFVRDPRGQEMIKHLNLSSYVLEEQRKAVFDAVLEAEFEDEDLLSDREYVETEIEDYDNMQDGKFVEFCSMITYCLREYYMPANR